MDLKAALRRHFGFEEFRPGQQQACEAACAGRDVLVVMPTGSGKSLCYQLPALLRDDLTIVVSPLVSLMQDQVEGLRRSGLGARAGLLSGQQSAATNEAELARAGGGELRLLYVAPERFASPGFAERVARLRIGLFVVDEAHCISQWGHDFRPDYLRLAQAARYVGAQAIFASTATATPRVARDVVRRLALRDPERVVTGFDRPNVALAVVRANAHEKRSLISAELAREGALPAIVYAGTRAGSEDLAAQLSSDVGEEAVPYHAGLDRVDRAAAQRRFQDGEAQIVVATNAFGMGVDKENVRTVVHATVPPSLEAYYQEAGRAGRDGAPARALLLAEARDKALHVHFIRRSELHDGMPRALFERLAVKAAQDGSYAVDARSLASAIGCSDEQVRALLGHLATAGVVEPLPSPPGAAHGRIAGPYDRRAATRCRASVAEGARTRWRQYREVWSYVERSACRRHAILRHFGDRLAARPVPCCDVCDGGLLPSAPPPARERFEQLDEAIVSVARLARPAVGRTTCAEILHGARTKKIERNAYDGLPAYGASSALPRADILRRIDALIDARRLSTTGGPYPVLKAPPAPRRSGPSR